MRKHKSRAKLRVVAPSTYPQRKSAYTNEIVRLCRDACERAGLGYSQYTVKVEGTGTVYQTVGIGEGGKPKLLELDEPAQLHLRSLEAWARNGGEMPIMPGAEMVVPDLPTGQPLTEGLGPRM